MYYLGTLSLINFVVLYKQNILDMKQLKIAINEARIYLLFEVEIIRVVFFTVEL
jgi:hypothetical protein